MSVAALELIVANRQNGILPQQVIALVQRHEFPEAVASLEVWLEPLARNVLGIAC